MSDYFEVKWEVDDGYVGGSRPHTTRIYYSYIEGMTEEEKDEYINERVQEDFEERIQWYITG